MINLFQNLKAVTDLPHGWTSFEKSKTLAGIILATRPALVIEVGVWSGRGTIACALACKDVGKGMVVGIDPYDPLASAEGQTGENLEWWSKQDHEAMFQYCQQQIAAFGVQENVTLIRKHSNAVDPAELGEVGLLILDGNHGPQAFSDIQRFSQRIPVGGYALLDDLNWKNGGVSLAVDFLLKNGFIECFRVQKSGDDWAVFQRVKQPKKSQ